MHRTHIRKGVNSAGGTDAIRMHFFYDAQGSVAAVCYNGVDYAYLHNLQGDVVGLMDMDGTVVVEYGYDAWGAPVCTEGSMADTLGKDNPFRYRGYVWDEETGLYYLRSRYYDPSWGRFVNADTQLSRGESRLFEHNAFSYCRQNPVNRSDSEGNTDIAATLQQNARVALPVLAPLTVNPVVAFFLVLLWPAPTANSDASAIPRNNGLETIPIASALTTQALPMARDESTAISTTTVLTSSGVRSARPSRTEIHHIVAQAAPAAAPARMILRANGIQINDPDNLVPLPYAVHRYTHTNAYYGYVNAQIISASHIHDGRPVETNIRMTLKRLKNNLSFMGAIMSIY